MYWYVHKCLGLYGLLRKSYNFKAKKAQSIIFMSN